MITIYGLYDSRRPGEIRYIGKTTKSLELRLSGHLIDARYRMHGGRIKTHKANWVQSVIATGGIVEIMPLDAAETNEAACDLEKFYIHWFRSRGQRLTNATDGGEGIAGFQHSERTRELIGKKSRGRLLGRVPWNKGRSTPVDVRAKQSAAHTGKRLTAEACVKMSEARRGKSQSLEHRANRAKAWLGRHHTDETRAKIAAKMSVIQRGKPKSPEHSAKIGAAQRGKSRRKQTMEDRTRQSARMREWWATRKTQEDKNHGNLWAV